jgi:hypothetical protein
MQSAIGLGHGGHVFLDWTLPSATSRIAEILINSATFSVYGSRVDQDLRTTCGTFPYRILVAVPVYLLFCLY